MRVSVVINTYNRGASLRQTLRALRHQTYPSFEVIVVNGPSADDTATVLEECAGAVRVADCPEVHLSKSRNLGVRLAAGEVVAFIDDDAIPHQAWLAELLSAYEPEVGGAGGIVYDHTGCELQYQYSVCSRTGQPTFPAGPPGGDCLRPGADPFVYLQGTNCSFRRECLVRIGGFDEEIEYFLDEVEVCMQVIDLGYALRPLPNAAVHHKYLPSHLRGAAKVVLNPYPLVKNRCYFALQNGMRTRPLRQVQRALAAYADGLRAECDQHLAAGRIDAGQRLFFLGQVERGLRDGTERGLGRPRVRRPIPPPDPAHFRPYPTVRPEGRRLTLCLLEPGGYPGADRTAAELAECGHEVHVIARSPDANRVDFEDGVWAHRLAVPVRHVPALTHLPWREALFEAASVYREVVRLHALRPLDAVAAAPSPNLALICALDRRFAIVPEPHFLQEALRRVAARAEAANGAREEEAGAVVARLAALLVDAAGLPPPKARQAAEALLDPACFPVDHAAAVLKLWAEPDETFVRGLFPVLLGREVDPPSLAGFLRHLGRGMPRYEIVRNLALSREAAAAGLPRGWLAAVKRAVRPRAVRRRRPLLDRMRVLVTRLVWAARRRLRPDLSPPNPRRRAS